MAGGARTPRRRASGTLVSLDPRTTRDWFEAQRPILQALLATLGTYLLTVLGTLPVLLLHSAPRRLMDTLMGFAAGVMVAA